jgi:hypothetical protein
MVEIPTIPKSFMVNFNMLMIVVIFFVITFVGLATFIPAFLGNETITPSRQQLNVQFTYERVAYVGQPWAVQATVNNPGKQPIDNVTIRIFSDGNVEGDTLELESVLPETTKDYDLRPSIKPAAITGNHSVETFVLIAGEAADQRKLDIEIQPSAPTASISVLCQPPNLFVVNDGAFEIDGTALAHADAAGTVTKNTGENNCQRTLGPGETCTYSTDADTGDSGSITAPVQSAYQC